MIPDHLTHIFWPSYIPRSQLFVWLNWGFVEQFFAEIDLLQCIDVMKCAAFCWSSENTFDISFGWTWGVDFEGLSNIGLLFNGFRTLTLQTSIMRRDYSSKSDLIDVVGDLWVIESTNEWNSLNFFPTSCFDTN